MTRERIVGFLIGFGVGEIVAILLAPKSREANLSSSPARSLAGRRGAAGSVGSTTASTTAGMRESNNVATIREPAAQRNHRWAGGQHAF
jgi:hypothetical protein